jgi:hypothetical protein
MPPLRRLFAVPLSLLATSASGVETLHVEEVRIADGVATITVTRTFAADDGDTDSNPGEVDATIPLPEGGAVTSLAVRAAGRWVAGELVSPGHARARFDEITAQGTTPPRAVALAEWPSVLAIYPVLPRQPVVVRYEISAPVTYADGVQHLDVPCADQDEPPIVSLDGPGGVGPCTDGSVDVAAPDDFASPTETPVATGADAAVHAGAASPVIVRYATVGTGPRAIAALQIDASTAFSTKPERANVVFLIDASKSARDAIPDEVGLARAYLEELPDASFETIAFRRFAQPLGDRGFASAADARTILAEEALEPANGSNLDEGLRAAARALRGRPGPARVVILTDGQMRGALDAELLGQSLALLPAGTIVHLVDVHHSGSADLDRDDGDPYAEPIAATGGETWNAYGVPAALPLVRPITLDDVTVSGDLAWADFPYVLAEGDGERSLIVADAAPTSITFDARLWGRHVSLVAPTGGALGAALPAIAIGSVADQLRPEEQLQLARLGHAVSPVTSYLAIDPTAGPSRKEGSGHGDDTGFGGRGGVGTSHCGGVRTINSRPQPSVDEMTALILPGARACAAKLGGGHVELELETTADEVVDVRPPETPLGACVGEAGWALDIPPDLALARAGYHLVLDL